MLLLRPGRLPAGGERAAKAAVKCFQAWLGLDALGGGAALVSPGELFTGHPQLFDALLAGLGSDSGPLLEVLAETLGMFFGAWPSVGKRALSAVNGWSDRRPAQWVHAVATLPLHHDVIAGCRALDSLRHCTGSGKWTGDGVAEDAALRAGAQGLLRQSGRVSAPDAEALARAVATVATAVAERSPEAFAGGFEEVRSTSDVPALPCQVA